MVADTLPRRLAAILHLDVVEFSRLTHDNEDATYRTLQNYLRDIDAVIENHGRCQHTGTTDYKKCGSAG